MKRVVKAVILSVMVLSLSLLAEAQGNVPGACVPSIPGNCTGGNGGSTGGGSTSRYEAQEYSRYLSAFKYADKLHDQALRAARDPAKALALYQRALSYIEEALQHEPGDSLALDEQRKINASIQTCQGQLAAYRGEYDRAISLFREAEAIDPAATNIWEKNIEWAQSLRSKTQKDALWASGSQLHDRADWKGAEAIWRQIIASDPSNSAAYYNLGITLENQDRIDEALAAFRQAQRLDPNDKNTNSRTERIEKKSEAIHANAVHKQEDSKAAANISANIGALINNIGSSAASGQTRSIFLPVNGKPKEFTVLDHPQSGPTTAISQLPSAAVEGRGAVATSRNYGADAKDRLELVFDTPGKAYGAPLPVVVTGTSVSQPPSIPEKYLHNKEIQGYLAQKDKADQTYKKLGNELTVINNKIARKEGNKGELDVAASKVLDQMAVAKSESDTNDFKAHEKARQLDLGVHMSEEPEKPQHKPPPSPSPSATRGSQTLK